MKRKGKILLALLAVALLVCIATVTLVACGEKEDSEPSNPQGSDGHTHEAEVFSRIVDPTCTEPGSEGANCTICGEYFTRDIAPLGHDLEWSIQELNGNLGDEVLTGTIHLTCKRNPYEVYDIEGTAVRTQYTAPTCDTEGSVTYNAKGEYEGFDYDVTETFKLAPHHDWVMDYEMVDGKPEVTLTCSRDGSHIYKTQGEIVGESIIQEGTCSVSGRKSIVISATDEDGHVYQKEDEIDYYAPHSLMGRYHQEGEELWEENTCANCDYISDMPLPKTLKEEQIYPCTDERDSFRTYEYHSEVWNSELEKTFYFKDHKFTEWGFAEEPTCRDEGTKAPKCSVCGELSEEGREPVQPSPEYHRFETVYDIDAHWEECSVCQEERGNHIAHAYDTVGECACGRELFEFELNQTDTYTLKKFNCGVNEVVIPAQYKGVDVTEIGDYAFCAHEDPYSSYFADITSVIISSSVKRIGRCAFAGCEGLSEITIPKSVISISEDAFDSDGLKAITVDPNNAVYQSKDGIVYKKADKSIYIIPRNTDGEIDLLDGVSEISSCLFQGCRWLKSIIIPDSVQSIGWMTFYDCTSLQTVKIGAGVKSIGEDAFSGCTGITMVNVTSLKSWCGIDFSNNYANPLYEANNAKLYLNEVLVTEVKDLDGLTQIPAYAFHGLTDITSVTIPYSVQSIGADAFYNCTGLNTINWNATNCSEAGSLYFPIFNGCTQLATLNIGEDIQSIPDYAFHGLTGITSVTIPDSVKSIGDYAFSGCTNITTATMPANVIRYIPKDSLTTVTITSGESIGSSEFSGCTGITSVTIPDSVQSIGEYAFYNCTGITKVNYLGDLKGWCEIEFEYAYANPLYEANNAKLYLNEVLVTEVKDLDGLTQIPAYAFHGLTDITSVTIPDSVQSIGEYAFYNCAGITKVNYLGDLKGWCEIEFEYAYANPLYEANNAKLYLNEVLVTEVKDLDGLTQIPAYAFHGLTDITSVTIPDSVQSIGNSAFECTGLKEITIPDSVTSIEDYAFCGCTGLQTVMIGEGVTSIGYYAFSGCKGLQTITIGNSVQSIDYCAFDGCTYIATATIPANAISYISIDRLTTVKITSGFIGEGIFRDRTGLQTATIGEGVTSIGNSAFSGCTGLQAVTIPESVKSIGEDAFYNCTGITKLNYLGDLKGWCEFLLNNASTNPMYAIGGAKLYLNDEEVTEVKDLDGLGSIPAYAFYYCKGITSVTIPDSVTSIGVSAFYYCTNLKSFDVAEGNSVYQSKDSVLYKKEDKSIFIVPQAIEGPVAILDGCTSIGNWAFSDCTGLTEITIPESVTSIGNYAFRDCTGLQTVNWNAISNPFGDHNSYYNNPIFYGCTSLTTVSIGTNVETMPVYIFKSVNSISIVNWNAISCTVQNRGGYIYSLFSGSTSPLTVNIGADVRSISDNVFGNARYNSVCKIKKVNYLGDLKGWCEIDFGDDGVYSPLNSTVEKAKFCLNNVEVTEVKDLDGLVSIPARAFSGCAGITSVTIPDSVTYIGDSAFQELTGITSVTIPESVTSIGDWAFYGCASLATVNWNATNCTRADSSSDYSIFRDCTSLTTVNIGDNVQSIPAYTFRECIGLQEITIPNSVTSIGSDAFDGCYKLVHIRNLSGISLSSPALIGGEVLTDANSEFTNALATDGNGIQTYTVGNTVYAIGYVGDSEALNLSLNRSIDAIYPYAFYRCANLTEISIPESVTGIGEYAFSGCAGIISVMIPDSVTHIGDSAFSGCAGITSVMIPDSVTYIGGSAFSGCAGITSVTIPESVTSIGWDVFRNCTGLQTVNWNAINCLKTYVGSDYSIFSNCTSLTTVNIGDNVQSIPSGAFNDTAWYNSQPDGLIYAGKVLYRYKGTMPQGTVIDNIKADTVCIASEAFRNCTGLQEIIIPDSVQSIGYDAFYNCTGLQTVTIGASVTSIGGYAFYGCTGLKSIIVDPDNKTYRSEDNCLIKRVSNELILGCKTSVIPNSVESIGESAFDGCTGLTSITIPNSVTSIGWNAFDGCTGLKEITIPDSVESIGSYAFQNCTSLREITIPDSVTSIGSYAFEGCTGLQTVTIGASVTSIGDQAFDGCTGLQTVYYKGTSEQWNDISIRDYDNGNDSLINAKRYYFSEQPNYDGEHWHWNEQTHTPEVWVEEN